MSTLSEITRVEQDVLEKIQLEPNFHCDPNQRENLLFLSPLLLLEDHELKRIRDISAKKVLGRVTKDILERNDETLFQVPEVIYMHMGYAKKSENKRGKMALSEEEAKLWKSFLNLSRFTRTRNAAEESASSERGEGTPMEIDFPTQADTQALEHPEEETEDLVSPSKSGLEIPLKGRYILLFSILLIFFDKKKKKKDASNVEEVKIGPNKISDFLLFWILPYLLSFNDDKVKKIIQHHRARGHQFNEFVETSTLDVIQESFTSRDVSTELKEIIMDKYKDYYGTEQLNSAYKLLKTKDGTPIILVPKHYIVKQMPAVIDDIGKNWRALGNVTLLDEFMNMFIKNKEIQEDFLYSLKDLKNRQGIDYSILLPDEDAFNELVGILEKKSAEFFSKPKVVQRGGRDLISPRIGLIKSAEKHLTVCFSFFQGNKSRRVAALFRAIGAHYLDHFTLALLHGLCLHSRDPQCRVGSLYPVSCARKQQFKGRHPDKKVKKKMELDFSEARGKFSRAEFPETYARWEDTVQQDPKVMKLISQTEDTLKIKPKFERDKDLTVLYSTAANTKKLQCSPFGAAMAQTQEMLGTYQVRAVNLNGCLLSMIAKCGRKDNVAVVLAINDECGKHGSLLPHLPDAIKMIVTHFVRAIVVAGLPTVYPPERDEEDREEIYCSSSEDEESSDDEATVTAASSGGARGILGSRSNQQTTTILHNIQRMYHDADRVIQETNLSEELTRITSEEGFIISGNPGGGNCMFYALSEQLQNVRGIQITHIALRNSLVQFLRENPCLDDGTPLINFVHGHHSWPEYLERMAQDGTWGDHVVLLAAANYYQTDIRVLSSLGHQSHQVINPDCRPVRSANPLILGHIHELHYVSLRQVKSGCPSEEDLEGLAQRIARSWKSLGRRLKIDEAELIGFHKDFEEFAEKAYQMLLYWKQRDGSSATYKVLSDALCHHLVGQRALAEQFCCVQQH